MPDAPPARDGAIVLRDGRRLAYTEFGDPRGLPVLWFHGTPGARSQSPPDANKEALERGYRFIAVDRPGVGDSSANHSPSLLSFADDIRQLSVALELERFAVMGLSGGGPYALACAHQLPKRVVVGVSLGGVGPTDGRDGAPGFPTPLIRLMRSLWPMRRVMGAAVFASTRPLKPLAGPAFDLYARVGPKQDRAIFRQPAMRKMFTESLRMAMDQGMVGNVYDLALIARPWGFSPRHIEVPIRIWHGDQDPVVPLSHSHHLRSVIPDCELNIVPGEGHFAGFTNVGAVLAALGPHFGT